MTTAYRVNGRVMIRKGRAHILRPGFLASGPVTTFWRKNADIRAITPHVLKTSYIQSYVRKDVMKPDGAKYRQLHWPQVATYKLGKYGDGGYPLFYVTADCDTLCADCATEQATHRHLDWPRIVAVDANYEDPDLYCGHCSVRIEAAYVDNEA